jgi:hypothetical protein
MLCEYVKHDNELFGYGCLAMDEVKKIDEQAVKDYFKAFISIKDHTHLIKQDQLVAFYKNSVWLQKNNKIHEFINYFTRNFSNLLNVIALSIQSEEIKNGADLMLNISKKYISSEIQDIQWSIN